MVPYLTGNARRCPGRLLNPQSDPGTLAPGLLENQPGGSDRPGQGIDHVPVAIDRPVQGAPSPVDLEVVACQASNEG